jgi:hypothetical protein
MAGSFEINHYIAHCLLAPSGGRLFGYSSQPKWFIGWEKNGFWGQDDWVLILHFQVI